MYIYHLHRQVPPVDHVLTKYTSSHLDQLYHQNYHIIVIIAYMIILVNVYLHVINIVVYFVSIIIIKHHLR